MSRLLWWVCLSVVVSCAPPVDLETQRQFEDAVEAARNASDRDDHLDVAARYRALIDEHSLDSGAVWFNLGNAYLRAGETGRAIAAYRQAEPHRPRDPYLEANLATARRDVGTEPPTAWFEQVVFWRHWVSLREAFQWTAAALTFASLAGILTLWRRRSLWRVAVVVGLLLTLGGALALALHLRTTEQLSHGVICVETDAYKNVPQQASLDERDGAPNGADKALTKPLIPGTEFLVQEVRGDWWWIRLDGDLEGWIPADSAVSW